MKSHQGVNFPFSLSAILYLNNKTLFKVLVLLYSVEIYTKHDDRTTYGLGIKGSLLKPFLPHGGMNTDFSSGN